MVINFIISINYIGTENLTLYSSNLLRACDLEGSGTSCCFAAYLGALPPPVDQFIVWHYKHEMSSVSPAVLYVTNKQASTYKSTPLWCTVHVLRQMCLTHRCITEWNYRLLISSCTKWHICKFQGSVKDTKWEPKGILKWDNSGYQLKQKRHKTTKNRHQTTKNKTLSIYRVI